MSDEHADRKAHEALVLEVMHRISTGHADDMVELLHDELVFELPYGPAGMPPSFDKPTFTVMQSHTFKMFSSFSLEPVAFHQLLDPAGLVAEYKSDCVVAASGKPYRNTYIGVFHFRDGKIDRWKEFHNPEISTEALS
jgi:ketosteroid isomerase-like protein